MEGKKKNLKILILTLYYDRPKMVISGLNSILNNNKTYENWELIFVDDGSKISGRPIVEKILKDHLHKIRFYCIEDTVEQKLKQGGHRVGEFYNQAIKESDAEIVINLADDDVLYEDYLYNLNNWFNDHPEEPYSCSDLIWFDPGSEIASKNIIRDFGQNCTTRLRNRLERQQYGDGVTIEDMAWRIKCNKEGGIWFPYPDTVFLDSFKVNLWKKYGGPNNNRSTNFFACYKSITDNSLLRKIVSHGRPHKYNLETHYKMIDIIYSGDVNTNQYYE